MNNHERIPLTPKNIDLGENRREGPLPLGPKDIDPRQLGGRSIPLKPKDIDSRQLGNRSIPLGEKDIDLGENHREGPLPLDKKNIPGIE